MRLSPRALNRTLLLRQHLLERTDATVPDLTRHLVGLQAQENLPPFLSLAARLTTFDPHDVTRGLEDRSLVRFLVMRGTVHLLVADDALVLRQWTGTVHEREVRISQNIGAAREVDREAFLAALSELLADGPLPQKAIGAALHERFPSYAATQLGQLARSVAPLVQCPPRGTWRGGGQVVYQYVDRWLGRPLVEPDVGEIVRRYLAAYGPATAADLTAWSAVTRLGPVVKELDDLVTHETVRPNGKVTLLYDVPGGAARRRGHARPRSGCSASTTTSGSRTPAATGSPRPSRAPRGAASTARSPARCSPTACSSGCGPPVDGRVEVLQTLRDLTRQERAELDDEIARVEALLAG